MQVESDNRCAWLEQRQVMAQDPPSADATKLIEEGKEPGEEAPLEPEHDAMYLALDNFERAIRGRSKTAAGLLLFVLFAGRAHRAKRFVPIALIA